MIHGDNDSCFEHWNVNTCYVFLFFLNLHDAWLCSILLLINSMIHGDNWWGSSIAVLAGKALQSVFYQSKLAEARGKHSGRLDYGVQHSDCSRISLVW